jgi:hypothetical protein
MLERSIDQRGFRGARRSPELCHTSGTFFWFSVRLSRSSIDILAAQVSAMLYLAVVSWLSIHFSVVSHPYEDGQGVELTSSTSKRSSLTIFMCKAQGWKDVPYFRTEESLQDKWPLIHYGKQCGVWVSGWCHYAVEKS